MKFRYFFISIFFIAIILQFNRTIDKGQYFSIEQNINFEKIISKNSKFEIKNENKYLIFYNPTSSVSNDTLNNLKEIFKFTKNEFLAVEITEKIDIKPYNYFIFATDDFIGFRKEVFENIKKKIYLENGTIFIFSGVKDNPFNKISGIKKIKGISNEDYGIKFIKRIFPGIDEWTPNKISMVSSGMNVELEKDVDILAYINDNKPFIWERKYGKGRIIHCNTDAFVNKVVRGVANQIISYGSDWYINPILKGKLIHIDDFPSPIPRYENKTIRKAYNMDTGDFYNKIWWQDMLSFAKRHEIIYSGFMIMDYNNNTDKSKMNEIPKITMQDLEKRGRELFIHGGELGLHGYNHNPLVFEGDIDFKELDYVPWENSASVKMGLRKTLLTIKELFGKEVKIYTYVPPSNILKKEGKRILADTIPSLKTISSLFYGDEEEAFVTEVGRDEDIPSIYNLPRFSSGFAYDKDMLWSMFNGISLYGYVSHFVHPDDIISDDRSFGKDWEEIFEEFEKMINEIEKRYPYLEGMTSSTLTKNYMNIENIKIFSKKEDNQIKIAVDNFRNPFSAWIRIRENEIKNISGGTYRLLKKYHNNNLYLIVFEKPEITIFLKERK